MPKQYQYLNARQIDSQVGFSLIESLLCLALISILSLLIGPSFKHLYQHQQSDHEINKIAHILRFARAQALTSRLPVSICPSTDGLTCGDRWEMGVMVFVDQNNNPLREQHEPLLTLKTPLSQDGVITFTGSRNRLSFSNHVISGGNAGSFIYCHTSGDTRLARSLIINFQGRVRSGTDKNKDQVEELSNGKNIACSPH